MKLIEALIVAHQEFGIYGDWKAIHGICFIGLGPHGNMYFAYDGTILIAQSERLEAVLSNFAQIHPHETLGEYWKVSRWT